jgi:hypothetical protein
MRKIKLNVESLSVESFATAAVAGEMGTVFGNEPTRGNNEACRSAVDACPTRICVTVDLACETNNCVTLDVACQTLECDTVVARYCPSAAFETCV